jgi:hypothetical protein
MGKGKRHGGGKKLTACCSGAPIVVRWGGMAPRPGDCKGQGKRGSTARRQVRLAVDRERREVVAAGVEAARLRKTMRA